MIMCLNNGTFKTINFQFDTNGKLMRLSVPILKHYRVTDQCSDDLAFDIVSQTLHVSNLPQ